MTMKTLTLPDATFRRALRALPADLAAEIEDAADAAALDAAIARDGPYLPAEAVRRLVDGEHPLRVWREHRGLTLAALADRVGVKKAYLSQVETRRRDGPADLYKRLAAALDVAIDDLVP